MKKRLGILPLLGFAVTAAAQTTNCTLPPSLNIAAAQLSVSCYSPPYGYDKYCTGTINVPNITDEMEVTTDEQATDVAKAMVWEINQNSQQQTVGVLQESKQCLINFSPQGPVHKITYTGPQTMHLKQ
jgi:hypothetical protein